MIPKQETDKQQAEKQPKPSAQEVRAALGHFRSTSNRHDLVDVLASALGIDESAKGDDVEQPAEPSVAQNASQEAPAPEAPAPGRSKR